MPIKRREIRESAFLLIFEKMFRQDEELDDIFMSAMEVNEIIVNDLVHFHGRHGSERDHRK